MRIGAIVTCFYLYPRHTKYAEGVYSFHQICPSIHLSALPSFHPSFCLSVHPWFHPLTLSITKFYFEVFWLLTTLQPLIKKLFIFGMGVPGRILFHCTSMNRCVMPWGMARGQNLGQSNKVVYCSLFVQTAS